MFKKISVFLVLVLVITTLSACAGSGLGMPNLSDEKKKEIENAWYTQYEWRWHDDPYGGRCRYYGAYEGYDIVFFQGDLLADVLGSKRIAGILFYSGNPFDLFGYRDGNLYEVNDLYEEGKLSAESIAAAAEIHDSEEKTLPLSDEKKAEISRAWNRKTYGLIWNSQKDQIGSAVYYGNFAGYDIVFQTRSFSGPGRDGKDTYPTITIADSKFSCKSFYFVIHGYKDGTLKPLHKLYEEGIIDAETIAEIAEVHRRSRKRME